ncbi:hypothetical protein GCM10009712_09820 [Pseudarthrobacter sulfonivorans]
MRSAVQYSAAPVLSTLALATTGDELSSDAAGAAVAVPAPTSANAAAAERLRRLAARDLVRVMIVLSERVEGGLGEPARDQ